MENVLGEHMPSGTVLLLAKASAPFPFDAVKHQAKTIMEGVRLT
jgi:hypothetical protein